MRRGMPLWLAAALATAAALAILAVSMMVTSPRRSSLLGSEQVFDSNVPVQWDSRFSREPGTSGLSRYFKSASADLRNRFPQARTFQLAELPSSAAYQQQLQSKDWDEANWSSEHKRNVGLGIVDSDSAKGIWHSGGAHTEAWEGIDEVFPTDTPYAFEENHIDHGEAAKMNSFISHVSNQMRLMEEDLKKAADKPEATARLTSVLEAGKTALAKIQAEIRERTVLPQLRQVADSRPVRKVSGLRAHYLSSKAARNDISAYFDGMESATESENRDNIRASGETAAAPLPLHQLRAVPEQHGALAQAFASEFATKLAEALEEKQQPDITSKSDSCQLCVKIFGCMDCCAPVCGSADPQPSATSGEKADASVAARQLASDGSVKADAVSQKAAEMMKVLGKIKKSVSKIASSSMSARSKLHLQARTPCECQSEECKECPDNDVRKNGVRQPVGSGGVVGSVPCECQSDECKECTDKKGARQRDQAKLRRAKRALGEAEKAISKTNDILVERIAALDATNEMAVRQGLGSYGLVGQALGAYGPDSDDEIWSSREPTPGKSEKVASGASDVIRGLMEEVGTAQQKAEALRGRLELAERAAQHGAEVTAEQRHLIRELTRQLDEQQGTAQRIENVYKAAGLSRYGGDSVERLATTSVLPFYEQPRYGGRGVRTAVKFFEEHPNQVRADVGGHPILSTD